MENNDPLILRPAVMVVVCGAGETPTGARWRPWCVLASRELFRLCL
jgi:hypothetical protein